LVSHTSEVTTGTTVVAFPLFAEQYPVLLEISHKRDAVHGEPIV
jgi:hypothetical protein